MVLADRRGPPLPGGLADQAPPEVRPVLEDQQDLQDLQDPEPRQDLAGPVVAQSTKPPESLKRPHHPVKEGAQNYSFFCGHLTTILPASIPSSTHIAMLEGRLSARTATGKTQSG